LIAFSWRLAGTWLTVFLLDSDIRRSGAEKNRNTEFWPDLPPQPVDLKAAYQMARAFTGLSADNRTGHRLVWVHRTSFAATTLVAREGAYAVVGRHTNCSVVLADDPFVALRHLLVRSVVLPSGGLALRVFDLHTSLGFGLIDGSRQTSVFAEGPIAISVGEYALVGLPSANELPLELPAPVIVTPPDVQEQLRVLEEAFSPYRANSIPLKTSRMTLMPRPISLDAIATTNGEYVVRLERAGRWAALGVSSADLDRGIIIGRSDKCSEALRNITDKGTSRVHVLLLREAGHVFLYDLASTQGTWAYNQRIGRTLLPDQGFQLQLGTRDPVWLAWQRRR
jgi:hypothetical protein